MVIRTREGAGIRRGLAIPLIALVSLLLPACRSEKPDQGPGTDTTAAATPQPPPLPPDTAVATVPIDTSTAAADPVTGEPPGGGAPGGSSSPGWKRSELVRGVQEFITAIDSGDQQKFWGSLSRRSMDWIDKGELGSKQEIWGAARETLGDIRNRRITVVGGTPDSVALRIDGLRMIEGVRENDPVIIDLLREGTEWKVIYPGLLYPNNHLRR